MKDDNHRDGPVASRSGGALDLPMIMSALEWRDSTARMFRTRSPALQEVDRALERANQRRDTAEDARAKYLATLNLAASQEGRVLSPIENNGRREGLDFAAATRAYDSALKEVEAAHRGWGVAEPNSRRNRRGAEDALASQLERARRAMKEVTLPAVEHIERTLDPLHAHISRAAFEDDRNQPSPSVATMDFAPPPSPPGRPDKKQIGEQPAPVLKEGSGIRRAAKRDSLQLYRTATADQSQTPADSRRPMRRPRANDEQGREQVAQISTVPRQRSERPKQSSPEASGSSQSLTPTRGRGRR